MKFKRFKISFLMATIVFFTLGSSICSAAQKVAVLPFEMNSTQDLTFLQKGLFSMLSSRLADPGKVEVINKDTIDKIMADAQNSSLTSGALNESKAKMIGANINADYILFGTVTIFGESISLDVSMVDISKQTKALTFSKQAKEPGAVITELDQIATEINFKVFGRVKEEIVPRVAAAQQSEPSPKNNFINPMTRYQVQLSTRGLINGVAVGDVDGDKMNEVILLSDHHLEIFKPISTGQLKSVKKINGVKYMNFISIDAADINKNGIDEIFVSRIDNRRHTVTSLVFEFNGTDYVNKKDPLPWYLRTVTDTSGEKTLYGQTAGVNGPFSSRDVFQIGWNNGRYIKQDKLMVPKGFSVLTLAKGRVDQSGKEGFLFTNVKGKLVWFDSTGTIEWEGDEGFGGSQLYFRLAEEPEDGRDKVYFHPRSIIYDIDSDGTYEVIAIRNIEATDHFAAQLKNFRKGELETFSWAGFGLMQKMLPKKIPGQITDIAILSGNGVIPDKLLISIVKKRNTFSKENSRSMVVAYDIDKNK